MQGETLLRYSDKVMCQKCHHKFDITHKDNYCYECGKACDGNVGGIIK